MTAKYARSSCGFCDPKNPRRHERCPGSLPHAAAGKPWACWCAENGHPDVVPEPPRAAKTPAPDAAGLKDTTANQSAAFQEPAAATPKPAGKRGSAPRCGHPTSRGPCKRVEGHTRGHDGR